MRKKKRLAWILAAAAGIALLGLGLKFYLDTHIFLDGDVYPRNRERLDLRGSGISVSQYDALRQRLPDCEILWDIPFQGRRYPQDTGILTVSTLSREDLSVIDYFPRLARVSGEACRDYPQLAALRQRHPEVEVLYTVTIDGRDYPQDARAVAISNITDQEIALLQYLPELETVHGEDCEDLPRLKTLWETYPRCQVFFNIPIGGSFCSSEETRLSLNGVSFSEVSRQLAYFPKLQKVHLDSPTGSAQELRALLDAYPGLDFSWQMDILGVTAASTDPEIDLSGKALDSVERVRQAMAYFPNARQVTWLKRLWWAGCPITQEEFHKFLPDTEMMFLRISSTGTTWREGQNYYDMRDLLGAPYMIG